MTPGDDDEVDDTVVIDREPTIIPAHDDELDERTVVIEKRRRRPEPDDLDGPDDLDDRTVSLGRRQPPAPLDDDATISLGRRSPDPDATISLGRRRPPAPLDDDPVLRLLPRRDSRARAAIGPNVVETYPARAVVLPPMPVVADTVQRAARAQRGVLPSVAARTRRSAIRALVLTVAAGVVSVAGVVGVIAWFVRG